MSVIQFCLPVLLLLGQSTEYSICRHLFGIYNGIMMTFALLSIPFIIVPNSRFILLNAVEHYILHNLVPFRLLDSSESSIL